MSATRNAQIARFVPFVALHSADAGERLADARENAGMTQQDAAEAIGIDRRTVQRYEAGEIRKMATVQALADAYGIALAEMFGEQDLPALRGRKLSDRLDSLEATVDEVRAAVGELLLRSKAGRSEQLASEAAERVRQAALRAREEHSSRTQASSTS